MPKSIDCSENGESNNHVKSNYSHEEYDKLRYVLLNGDWEQAGALLKSDGIAFFMKDINAHLRQNENLLYIACTYYNSTNIPMSIVEKLYHLLPEQINFRDNNDRSILHIACYRSCVEVVSFLLRYAPNSAYQRDRYGKFPLHLATSCNCSFHIVEALVIANPEAINCPDTNGCTPFHSLLRRQKKLIKLRMKHGNNFSHINPQNDHIAYDDVQTTKKKFLLFLKYILKHKTILESNDHHAQVEPVLLFHESLKLSFIPTIYLLFQMDFLQDNDFNKKDECGNTILHIALSYNHQEESFINLLIDRIPNKQRIVLERNKLGQLPLALAIQHRNEWNIVQKILHFAPSTISLQIDLSSRLFPFMIAATASKFENAKTIMNDDNINSSASLTIIYSLLRLDPSLVMSGIPPTTNAGKRYHNDCMEQNRRNKRKKTEKK